MNAGSVSQGPAQAEPTELDFGRILNKPNNEIVPFLESVHERIHIQGEYDQDDYIALDFDTAADTIAIALRLARAWAAVDPQETKSQ